MTLYYVNSYQFIFHIVYFGKYNDLVSSNERYRHIPGMQPQTTFVNETGMNMFVLRSRMPKAEIPTIIHTKNSTNF